MFEKNIYSSEYLLAHFTYRKKINKDNIGKLSANKIAKIFNDEDPQIRFMYMHNVLSRYNKKYYQENYTYLDNLKGIIRRNKIPLNTKEMQFIYLLEERIFSKIRKLKVLDTDYPLAKGEHLYVRYKKGNAYFLDKGYYKSVAIGEMLLTNKKIIIKTPGDAFNYEFYYSEIRKYNYYQYGFRFKYGNETVLMRAHDQLTLCNIMKRIEKNKWLKIKYSL